jgi:hypothetical protein
MTTIQSDTLPAPKVEVGLSGPEVGVIVPTSAVFQTIIADFSRISHLLSARELRRPRSMQPSQAELKRMAEKNPPPPEWHEGEAERPF